jgi:hypothetical protein
MKKAIMKHTLAPAQQTKNPRNLSHLDRAKYLSSPDQLLPTRRVKRYTRFLFVRTVSTVCGGEVSGGRRGDKEGGTDERTGMYPLMELENLANGLLEPSPWPPRAESSVTTPGLAHATVCPR